MPASQSSTNPISRLLRLPPHRELFRALADSLDEAVLVLSADFSDVQAANHAFLLLSGYARNELETLEPGDLFVGPAGEELLTQLSQSSSSGETLDVEIPLRTREGTLVPLDLQVIPVAGPSPTLLIKARPSSIRLDQELEQAEWSEQLELLGEIARLLLDVNGVELQPAIERAKQLLSASAFGLYCLSAAEPEYLLQGKLPAEFPERLQAAELDPLDQPIAWAKGDPAEHSLHRAGRALGLKRLRTSPLGGAEAWIGLLLAGWRESDAWPQHAEAFVGMLATLFHAGLLLGMQRTALEDAEQHVQRLDRDFQRHMSAVGDAVLSLNANLAVARANDAACQLLGYSAQELADLPVQEVLVGPPDIMTTLLDVLGHQRATERNRLTIHRRDGSPLTVHLRAVPMERGSSSRLLLVLRDQSEVKAIEDQTEILAQRALLGEVAAIFAHEVRNPINNISTGLQLVASRLGGDHPQHASLEKIRNECNRLDQLMEDVLFFARPLELKIQPHSLPELMDRMLARWEPRLGLAGVKIHRNFAAGTPRVLADSRTLEQVITNLITNAIQAMPEGGTLSVGIAPTQTKGGPMVELKITDTGPGIRQDLIDRIFDPFFTTKKTGTGLGLAISRRIMMAHQGGISVESYPDAGTVFTVQIRAESSNGEGIEQ